MKLLMGNVMMCCEKTLTADLMTSDFCTLSGKQCLQKKMQDAAI